MAGERQARVADRIRVVLSERLQKGLRDPRLGFVTITEVRVTGDLQHASVFYTVYGTDEESGPARPPRSSRRRGYCAARSAASSTRG